MSNELTDTISKAEELKQRRKLRNQRYYLNKRIHPENRDRYLSRRPELEEV